MLPVQVDDVLHQEVPLQPVDAVAVQHHFVTAGGAPEAAPADHHPGGAAGVTQRVGLLHGFINPALSFDARPENNVEFHS